MKPHQTAHSQWSILVSHTSAGSTAAGLLCLATCSSGLHIFTSQLQKSSVKALCITSLVSLPKPPPFFAEGCSAVGIFVTINEAEWQFWDWDYMWIWFILCGLSSRHSSCIQKSNTTSGTPAFLHTWEIGRQKTSLIHRILTTEHICYLSMAFKPKKTTKLTNQTPKPYKTGQLTASENLRKILIV